MEENKDDNPANEFVTCVHVNNNRLSLALEPDNRLVASRFLSYTIDRLTLLHPFALTENHRSSPHRCFPRHRSQTRRHPGSDPLRNKAFHLSRMPIAFDVNAFWQPLHLSSYGIDRPMCFHNENQRKGIPEFVCGFPEPSRGKEQCLFRYKSSRHSERYGENGNRDYAISWL